MLKFRICRSNFRIALGDGWALRIKACVLVQMTGLNYLIVRKTVGLYEQALTLA